MTPVVTGRKYLHGFLGVGSTTIIHNAGNTMNDYSRQSVTDHSVIRNDSSTHQSNYYGTGYPRGTQFPSPTTDSSCGSSDSSHSSRSKGSTKSASDASTDTTSTHTPSTAPPALPDVPKPSSATVHPERRAQSPNNQASHDKDGITGHEPPITSHSIEEVYEKDVASRVASPSDPQDTKARKPSQSHPNTYFAGSLCNRTGYSSASEEATVECPSHHCRTSVPIEHRAFPPQRNRPPLPPRPSQPHAAHHHHFTAQPRPNHVPAATGDSYSGPRTTSSSHERSFCAEASYLRRDGHPHTLSRSQSTKSSEAWLPSAELSPAVILESSLRPSSPVLRSAPYALDHDVGVSDTGRLSSFIRDEPGSYQASVPRRPHAFPSDTNPSADFTRVNSHPVHSPFSHHTERSLEHNFYDRPSSASFTFQPSYVRRMASRYDHEAADSFHDPYNGHEYERRPTSPDTVQFFPRASASRQSSNHSYYKHLPPPPQPPSRARHPARSPTPNLASH
ncbi:hypothetical protein SISSUDRAFT_651676 [Sistotremastrum suecicum HHB10207 ss-3]|uniref:Uncharacterized protein n=1 Tax=Sistotremastrum suecicum HHB10207 ss-3 TaxID=1314776 RepID=A0A166E7I3_9AGAM|nr:hypothetical protein SISSUDRAFT_651676 [Sistotremastrum suecicum HHB10207 ss-3]